MDDRQPAKQLGSTRTTRRRVLTRSAQLGAAITGVAASGGIASIVASAKAPAYFQDSAPSGTVRFLVYGEAAEDQPVHEAFQALYPEVTLEVVGIPGGTWAQFADAVTTRIAGGEQFDVVQIALPLAVPAIAALAVLNFQAAWNDFFAPNLFLTTPDKFTLPVGLVALRGMFGGTPTTIFAGVTLVLIPVLIVYLLAQRRLTESIALTGIRG